MGVISGLGSGGRATLFTFYAEFARSSALLMGKTPEIAFKDLLMRVQLSKFYHFGSGD